MLRGDILVVWICDSRIGGREGGRVGGRGEGRGEGREEGGRGEFVWG